MLLKLLHRHLFTVHQPKHASQSCLTANRQAYEDWNLLWMSQITIILQGTKYLIHSPSHRQYILTPPWRRKPKKCHLVRTRSTKSRIYRWHCSIVPTAGRNVLHVWVWLLLNQNTYELKRQGICLPNLQYPPVKHVQGNFNKDSN